MITDKQVDDHANGALDDLNNGALMLWLMKHEDLQESVEAGREYFESKYGLRPNVCIINPADAVVTPDDTMYAIGDMLVATASWCLKGHALIGLASSADSGWGVSF